MVGTVGRLARTWLPWIGGGFLAAWALSMLWWALLEPAQAAANEETLIIPEGTAAAVAAGAPAPFIPNSLELARDGELTIINRDTVPHDVGSWTIPPGGSAVISASDEEGQFECTIHPGGILGFSIDQRPSILTTLYAALILGLPVGFVFGLASVVGSRLRLGHEEAVTGQN